VQPSELIPSRQGIIGIEQPVEKNRAFKLWVFIRQTGQRNYD
jgi:hypothetical protein